MNRTRVPIYALLISLACTTQAGTKPESKQAQSARKFVQGFYDWYVKIANDDNLHTRAWDVPLKQMPTRFSPKLRSALLADSKAQDEEKEGYIVSLDWDPILASQDPDPRYVTGKIRHIGHLFHVDIHRVPKGQPTGECVITALVENHQGHWRFTDFRGPDDGQSLFVPLRLLKEDRKKYARQEAKKKKRP